MGQKLRAVSIMLMGSALASGTAAPGCIVSTDCTDIGCESGLTAEITFRDRMWSDGMYELELMADGHRHLCSFSFPPKDAASANMHPVRCEGEDLEATLRQNAPCSPERVGTTLMQVCTPNTAQYTLNVELAATPKKLQLRATRDAELLTEQEQTLEYDTFRPNGGACEPVCMQSSAKMLLD